MTNENIIKQLKRLILSLQYADDVNAVKGAIQALSQEPCDDATLKDIFCMGCEYREQESCEDAISREAVKDILNNSYSLTDAEHRVEHLPSVTQKSGKWITKPHVYGVTYCSECDFELKIDDTNYCPNCGAKMESEVNNG